MLAVINPPATVLSTLALPYQVRSSQVWPTGFPVRLLPTVIATASGKVFVAPIMAKKAAENMDLL